MNMAAIAVATDNLDDLCRTVREEYERMPRMRLTAPQFQRVWRLSDRERAYVLDALVARGVLVTDAGGTIRLATPHPLHHAA
jgi:hypothetical protein